MSTPPIHPPSTRRLSSQTSQPVPLHCYKGFLVSHKLCGNRGPHKITGFAFHVKYFKRNWFSNAWFSKICFDKSMSHINIVEWKLQWTCTVCTCSTGSKPDDVPVPHPVQLSHCHHCCCCNPEVQLPSLESVAPKY